jgi:hypothetical protein
MIGGKLTIGYNMQNDLDNTEWQIITAHPEITLMNWQGLGNLPALSCSGHTTGSNLVTFYCSATSQLKNGDLVLISGGHPVLTISSLEVENLIPNVSFQARLPRRVAPPTSSAVTARPIQRGDVSGNYTTHAADGWTKTLQDWFWVDDNPQNQDSGTKRVAAIMVKNAGNSKHYRTLSLDDSIDYAGQPFCVKFRVKSSGDWRIYIKDNGTISYGATQSGSGYVEAQHAITSCSGVGPLEVGVEHLGVNDTVYYYSKPFATNAASIPAGYYRQKDGWFKPVVKYSPNSLSHATIEMPATADSSGAAMYGFPVNLRAETNGAMSNDIQAINLSFEAMSSAAGRALAWRDQEPVPHNYGELVYTQGANNMAAGNGEVWLKNGNAYLYSTTASALFTNVSADLSAFYL